jgi:hypothetical protein
MQNNAPNTLVHGAEVTDTVATWIKEKFVSGPFAEPPTENFRVNSLMAIDQGVKIRPVLNGSLPLNRSLNSNVDQTKVEKVQMCSARCFSYSVKESGVNSFLAKIDMQNAYKNVPCLPSEFRLQGFHWLSKFFVETTQIFGAKTAVSNFDILGNTLLALTMTECSIKNDLVHRQLDDVPIVVPNHKKEWCDEFVENYKNCCKKVNVSLAEDDPLCDKAFSSSQEGKVLGIIFRTKDLTWSYPEKKRYKCLAEILKFINSEVVSLLQMQKLMGRLNDIGLMIPFLNCFKGPLNEMLSYLQLFPNRNLRPSKQSVLDVKVWAGFLQDPDSFHPISPRPIGVPLSYFTFTSDAAGYSDEMPKTTQIGVGSIGFNVEGEICLAAQWFWPSELKDKLDSKGARFGSKTVFLELIGLLIPFILIPDIIKNSHVCLFVDNIGCYYGWENHSVKNDVCASIVVRALNVISAFLEVYVHVKHLPRLSSWEAKLCDRLSRSDTTSVHDKRLLDSFSNMKMPDVLKTWLKNPVEDWNICSKLLHHVKEKMK